MQRIWTFRNVFLGNMPMLRKVFRNMYRNTSLAMLKSLEMHVTNSHGNTFEFIFLKWLLCLSLSRIDSSACKFGLDVVSLVTPKAKFRSSTVTSFGKNCSSRFVWLKLKLGSDKLTSKVQKDREQEVLKLHTLTRHSSWWDLVRLL